MTEVNSYTLEASGLQSIRLGINWDPLLRDKLENNKTYNPKKDNLFKAVLLQIIIISLWIFALLCRLTLILWRVARKIDATRKKLNIKQVNLNIYISQKDLPSYDLDLCCFCYENDQLVGFVLPTFTQMFGKVGWLQAFNHSGDDDTGLSETFDEELLIKLKMIDERINHLFFIILSKNHGFNRIKGGSWSLFDTTRETEIMSRTLKTQLPHKAYVMAEATRKGGDWIITEVLEFLPVVDNGTPDQERVDEILQKYMTKVEQPK